MSAISVDSTQWAGFVTHLVWTVAATVFATDFSAKNEEYPISEIISIPQLFQIWDGAAKACIAMADPDIRDFLEQGSVEGNGSPVSWSLHPSGVVISLTERVQTDPVLSKLAKPFLVPSEQLAERWYGFPVPYGDSESDAPWDTSSQSSDDEEDSFVDRDAA